MKNYKTLGLYIFVLLFCKNFSLYSQEIQLEFPYFGGYTYDFKIFQADRPILLKQDTIPANGKVKLSIPKVYEGYQGMAQWYITNSGTGGGLDLVINNEDFSVSCSDSIPTAENIIYKNTKENLLDIQNYKIQQSLFQQHDALLAVKRAYPEGSSIFEMATKEYDRVAKIYDTYNDGLSSSQAYAPKFRQIVNLTMGIGTKMILDETKRAEYINSFITNDLDFTVLYTSNHWEGIINNWVQLHTAILKDDKRLISDAQILLGRIKQKNIYTDAVISITMELAKAGKDNVIDALKSDIKTSNKLESFDGVLKIYEVDLSGSAPDLIFRDQNVNLKRSNVKNPSVKTNNSIHEETKQTLLIFYKSDCGNCEDLIQGLLQHYERIKENGIRIITISADEDKVIFTETSKRFPWPDKYCDFEGMTGINFINYAVIGTPTLYLINKDGNIQRKSASLELILENL